MADYKAEAREEYFDNLPEEEYIRSAIEAFPDFFSILMRLMSWNLKNLESNYQTSISGKPIGV